MLPKNLYIYQANSKVFARSKKLEELLRELPVALHERALRYKVKRDAYNFVLGRLLLKKGLEDLGLEEELVDVKYNEKGKPSLDSVFFSISHSDDLVICALSKNGPLGVDVEKVKTIVLDDFRAWFRDEEWADIMGADNSLRRFYWYWTRKESIIKSLGVDLDYLHRAAVDPELDVFVLEGREWCFRELDLGLDFFGVICLEYEIGGNHVKYMRSDFTG